MKHKLFVAVSLCSVFSISAGDFGKFAVQGNFSPFRISDIDYSGDNPPQTNSLEVGARIKPISRFGIDLMFGASYFGGIDANVPRKTSMKPSSYSATVKAGGIYMFYEGEKSNIGGIITFGGTYEKRLVQNYSSNTTSYDSYTVFTPIGFIGIEPSVDLSKNFSFYTRFGLQVMNNPATKTYQYSGYDFNTGASQYVLVELANEYLSTKLDGFCLGFRFQF